MNSKEFILKLVDQTIWPIILLVVIILTRKGIKELVPGLKKAKFKDFEIEFDKQISKIKEEAKEEFPEQKDDLKLHLISLTQVLPNESVLEAWKEIEQRAEKLILTNKPDINIPAKEKYKRMQEILMEENFIEAKKAKVFHDLRMARNKAAHAEGHFLSQEQALSYVSVAIMMIGYLEGKIKSQQITPHSSGVRQS